VRSRDDLCGESQLADELTSAGSETSYPARAPGSPAGVRRARRRLAFLALAMLVVLPAAVLGTAALLRPEPDPAWQLVWADNFNGTALSAAKWTAENNSTFGDGNNELACLMSRSANVQVGRGVLILRALRETEPLVCNDNDPRFPDGRSYTSAMVSTQGKASWHEGLFEVRAKLPLGAGTSKGLWPAFWMRPASGSGDGELDVMEAIGTGDPSDSEALKIHQTLWYDERGTYPQRSTAAVLEGGPADGFHTYAVEWRPGVMRWYVDGKMTFRCDSSCAPWLDSAFDGRFFIRLNLAVGGTFPGSPDSSTAFPAEMVVDWIKVFQWR
jgi:beta-glucanase (GH16 family)